jgi:hypothetical protein
MKPERWKEIEAIYHQAQRETHLRSTFLDEACAGDGELRRQIQGRRQKGHRILAGDAITGSAANDSPSPARAIDQAHSAAPSGRRWSGDEFR